MVEEKKPNEPTIVAGDFSLKNKLKKLIRGKKTTVTKIDKHPNLHINRRVIRLFRAVLVIALVSLLVYGSWFVYKKTLAPALEIGSTKISRKDYNKLISQAAEQKVSQKDATDLIIEVEKQKITIQQLQLTINENDVYQAIAAKYNMFEPSKHNEWQKLNGDLVAAKNTVLNAKHGGWQGAFFAFPYSSKFVQTLTPMPDHPGFGDNKEIAKDKAYAMAKAEEYRTKIKNGQIATAKAIEEIVKDKRLDYGGAGNDSIELFIDGDGNAFSQGESVIRVFDGYIVNAIKGLKDGELSDIGVIRTNVSMSPLPEYKGTNIPTGYYFVQLKTYNKANQAIEKQFEQKLKDIKVKRNV